MMTRSARLLIALAGLLLLSLYVVPVWRISLVAPQYPEGLGMEIHVNTVRGVKDNDLQNINGLNHYIGMKHIEPDAIPVLRIIPWVVGALALSAVLVGVIGRRALVYGWLGTFVAAGATGMATFWWWEYDYGHHLDMAQAIIKVPGMSYQPPLIGSRQILNFTATSYPAIGGWLAALAFLLGVAALFVSVSRTRKASSTRRSMTAELVHAAR
jgi:copper chaperone NosL